MNYNEIIILKVLRYIYTRYFVRLKDQRLECLQDPDEASKLIFNALSSDKPCMIARFGGFELSALVNYKGVKSGKKNIFKYIKGEENDWWWNDSLIKHMHTNAGFFQPTIDKISQFCELMFRDTTYVDILGSWMPQENKLHTYLNASKIHLRLLEPFWCKTPWTKVLEGKKILVVHPFSDTIVSQYEHRKLLFENQDVLPHFKSLQVIQAVQSLGEGDTRFKDWFEALDFMKKEIDKHDYDVCLIGAGAYGFPLAAHVKRSGKKAVHLGGALQLLFGIKGKRWEDPNYGVKEWGIPYGSYNNLINKYWVRPGNDLKPKNADQVEGACYW